MPKPKTKKRTERSTPITRAKRYARVGGKLSGIAAKAATQRLFGMEIDQSKEALALKNALGGLKGPLMKIAQILGTIPGSVPEEYEFQLRQLQTQAPSTGWPFVRRRMMAELGPDWQKLFKSFDHEASAAASLGQVHKAAGKDGTILACKLQYPDMESAVDADLKQLALILKIYKNMHGGVDTKDVYQEISERLCEELDYELESKHMLLYAHMLRDEKNVHIPTPIPDLSTKRLLTMNWLDGKPILDFKKSDLKIRNTLALHMFRAWYVPFYNYGIIHGDPHLGNYSVRPDLSINLLDFGCVRVFNPDFVKGVIDLYFALADDKPELAVEAYKAWGFKNPSKQLIDVLNKWANFLYGPILQDKVLKMSDTHSGDAGRKVASEVHAELRKIGSVKPPREFVFMDRAAVGLGSVFIHLNAEINWYKLFHELIAGFDAKKLAKMQTKVLRDNGL